MCSSSPLEGPDLAHNTLSVIAQQKLAHRRSWSVGQGSPTRDVQLSPGAFLSTAGQTGPGKYVQDRGQSVCSLPREMEYLLCAGLEPALGPERGGLRDKEFG